MSAAGIRFKKGRICVLEFPTRGFTAGTGSCPHPPQGLHRQMRFTASQPPPIGPWVLSASSAYSEQLGSKRHSAAGPNRKVLAGDKVSWYTRTSRMRADVKAEFRKLNAEIAKGAFSRFCSVLFLIPSSFFIWITVPLCGALSKSPFPHRQMLCRQWTRAPPVPNQ